MIGTESSLRYWPIALLIGLQSAFLGPNLALYARFHLELEPAEVGLFFALFNASAIICNLAIPAIADRSGDRRLALVAVAIAAVGASLVLFAVSEIWMALAAVVLLLGPATCLMTLFFSNLRAISGDPSVPVRLRSLVSFAWIVGPAGAGLLLEGPGFAAFFACLGLINLLIAALALRLPTNVPQPDAVPKAQHPKGAARGAVLLIFVFCLLNGTNMLSTVAVPIIVVENLALPPSFSGYLFGICALLEIPLFLAAARVANHASPRTIVTAASLAGALYFIILATSSDFVVILTAQVLNAIFIVGIMGVGMTWFQDRLPVGLGLATGIFVNTARVGALVAIPAGSIAAQFSGGDYRAAVTLAVGINVFSMICLLFVRAIDESKPSSPRALP